MKLRERPKGRPVLIFELDRSLLEGSSEVESLSSAAQKFEDASADCLCLSTDASNGLKDMFTVARAVKIPVFARDWYIHPLQVQHFPRFLLFARLIDRSLKLKRLVPVASLESLLASHPKGFRF